MDKDKGNEPEVLAKFGKSARQQPDGQPVRDGMTADGETKGVATDPKLKQDAATKVLREGAMHKDQGSEEAIDKLPDRVKRDKSP